MIDDMELEDDEDTRPPSRRSEHRSMAKPEIYVFGSNLAGRHGAGSAKYALMYHGAIYGQGKGLQGKSYGIPTKDAHLLPLPLADIKKYIHEFLMYAREHRGTLFVVVEIGCGLAGFKPEQIAPMFVSATPNVHLPASFVNIICKMTVPL